MGAWALLRKVLGASFDIDIIGVACSFWSLATAIQISGPGRGWDFCCRALVCFPKVLAVLWFIVVLIYFPFSKIILMPPMHLAPRIPEDL